MGKMGNREVSKILVDYLAVTLTLTGVVLIIYGIGSSAECKDLEKRYYFVSYNSCSQEGLKIPLVGVCNFVAGILLLVGIIKRQRIPVLIYLVVATVALLAITVYYPYYIYRYVVFQSPLFWTTTLLYAILITFNWWLNVSVYLFYQELAKGNEHIRLVSV